MFTLNFIGLFVAGMRAGIEVAMHSGVGRRIAGLDDRAQIQVRQALVFRLRVLVPIFFVPTAALGTTITILDGATSGVWFRCAGLVTLLVWALMRVIRTVPINSATLTWDPDLPPSGWATMVDRAERFHVVGVWAAVMAFACFLAALGYSALP
jgi:hypothetical protein